MTQIILLTPYRLQIFFNLKIRLNFCTTTAADGRNVRLRKLAQALHVEQRASISLNRSLEARSLLDGRPQVNCVARLRLEYLNI